MPEQGPLTDKPADDQHVSTVEILHQHNRGPSPKAKILIPIVLLAIGAVLVGTGVVIWDHTNRGYSKVGSVAQVVARGQSKMPEPSGLAALLQPDDSRFVSLGVRAWDFWVGKGAVTQGHFMHIPDLKSESVEVLVRGERSAASLAFRMDLSRTEGTRYHVDEIYRGGMPTGEGNLTMEIFPLQTGGRPAESTAQSGDGYMQSGNVAYDRDNTFTTMKRFVAQGRLQQGNEGFWIQSSRFNVALNDELQPGIRALLNSLANTVVSEKAKFFLSLDAVYPWSENGKPGRRQTDHLIGTARLDGILLGSLYTKNGE